jgi:3-hydroxyisobutyrate dehydrogenase
MIKNYFQDLGLAQNASSAMKSPTPLGSLAHQIYRLLCQQGYGGKDFGVVFKFLQEQDSQ